MQELIDQLKTARASSEFYKTEMKAMLDKARDTDNFRLSENGAKQADAIIETLEKQIKDAALEEYKATGVKQQHANVTVKIFKAFRVVDPLRLLGWVSSHLIDAMIVDIGKLDYPRFLSWVKHNAPDAITADLRRVEEYARKIGNVDGVELIDDPQVQISKKL